MAKYPSLDGRKRKVYMSKAELPESQVLTVLHLTVTHGLSSCSTQTQGTQALQAMVLVSGVTHRSEVVAHI